MIGVIGEKGEWSMVIIADAFTNHFAWNVQLHWCFDLLYFWCGERC